MIPYQKGEQWLTPAASGAAASARAGRCDYPATRMNSSFSEAGCQLRRGPRKLPGPPFRTSFQPCAKLGGISTNAAIYGFQSLSQCEGCRLSVELAWLSPRRAATCIPAISAALCRIPGVRSQVLGDGVRESGRSVAKILVACAPRLRTDHVSVEVMQNGMDRTRPLGDGRECGCHHWTSSSTSPRSERTKHYRERRGSLLFCPRRRARLAVASPGDLDARPQPQATFASARLALVASPHQISWSSVSLAEGKSPPQWPKSAGYPWRDEPCRTPNRRCELPNT